MTDLDQFAEDQNYILSGETLNKFVAAITERTPLAGDGLLATELPHGVMFRLTDEARGIKKSGSSGSSGSNSLSSSSSSSSGSSGSVSGSPELPPGDGSMSSSGSPSSGSSQPSSAGASHSSASPGSGGSSVPSSAPSGPGSGGSTPDGPGSGSGSQSGSGPGSGSGSAPGSGSKTAIVRVELRPGSPEWIAWYCIERDEVTFEICRDVPLTCGLRGRLKLPAELVESCEPGSLRVAGAMAVGACGCATASVAAVKRAGKVEWQVEACCIGAKGLKRPHAVRVRIEGVRKGHTMRWERFTEREADANAAFWGLAREVVVG